MPTNCIVSSAQSAILSSIGVVMIFSISLFETVTEICHYFHSMSWWYTALRTDFEIFFICILFVQNSSFFSAGIVGLGLVLVLVSYNAILNSYLSLVCFSIVYYYYYYPWSYNELLKQYNYESFALCSRIISIYKMKTILQKLFHCFSFYRIQFMSFRFGSIRFGWALYSLSHSATVRIVCMLILLNAS